MTNPERKIWPLALMLVWFGMLAVLSGGLAVLGLAFANEPGGRGNPGLIDYAMIFGPLMVTVALAAACVFAWLKGHATAAYIICALPVLAFVLLSGRYGL